MFSFEMPRVYDNPESWGPKQELPGAAGACNDELGIEERMVDFNLEHLEKYPMTRIGRVCDFTAAGQRYAEQRAAKGKGKGKGVVPIAPKDDEGFALVDSRPPPGKSGGKGRGFGGGKSKGKGKAQVNYQDGFLGQRAKFFANDQQKGKGKGKGKGFKGGKGVPSFKDWSVHTKTEWHMVQEIMLFSLAKLQVNSKDVQVEDLLWCGTLHNYNKEFDRVTVKMERPLRRFEDLNFFNVSTSDDPIMQEYVQEDPTVTVVATDHVLACLIAAARSQYSWDIVVSKIGGKLIFDKRDGSHIDFLTVNETASDQPNNDEPNHINAPTKLGQEASCINQNFSQIVLDPKADAEVMERKNPFDDDEDEDDGTRAASGAYRYRKFTLPGNPKEDNEFNKNPVNLVVRTEVNCRLPGAADSYVSVKALNEFDPKQGTAWRTHLESQRGAVLATELKNNAFKLGRWTAQAMLAGCDTIKVGYVSRVLPSDPWTHTILGVQTHFTDGFAAQIGMTRNNVWGIIRSIIDVVMAFEDGKYLLLKDPTKPVMRIYEVPWETFGEEEVEESEPEDEGPELDAEGNAPVPQPEGVGGPQALKPMGGK